MMNRNKYELERLRRYRDPDDEDDANDAAESHGRVKWFGIRLKESYIFRIGFGLVFLMVALLYAKTQLGDRVAWIPNDALWFNLGFLAFMMLLSFTSFSMFYCGSMTFKRQIREMDERMARRDNATPEEVQEIVRQSEKRLNRRAWLRSLFFVIVFVALFPVLGTELLFPWGGVLPFVGALAVVFGGAFVWWYHRQDVADKLRWWAYKVRR